MKSPSLLITLITTALAAPLLAAEPDPAVLANYNKHCVSCHAKDGSGKTTMGRKVGAKDYTDAKVVAGGAAGVTVRLTVAVSPAAPSLTV